MDHVHQPSGDAKRCLLCGALTAPSQIAQRLSDERLTHIARDYVFRTVGRLRVLAYPDGSGFPWSNRGTA
jgi:hypothetical protein